MFIVIEIQVSIDGTVGNIVTAYDERSKAEQKYHAILSAAAVSGLPKHSAVILCDDGRSLMYQCYRNETPDTEEPVIDGI